MKRALLFAGDLTERGGGTLVGAWAAQALLRDHAVTLVSWQAPDLGNLDGLYGTRLAEASGLTVAAMPPRLVRAFTGQPLQLALLRRMLLERFARTLVETLEPEVLVSTANETDLGRPLVQYLHYPWALYPRPEAERRWFHLPPAVRLYRALVLRVGRFDPRRQAANATLANSDWTAALYRRCYGLPARTLPPPVPVEGCGTDWADRRADFIAVGRISREKRLLEAVRLVERLRAAGHAVGLRICGFADDPAYLAELQGRLAGTGGWATLELDLPRARLLERIGQCRYGLHMMVEEHFGIAVAEMIRLGCIPFVHASGGPLETVGALPLAFASDQQAFELIDGCLADPEGQAALRARLAERAERFAPERFEQVLLACCAEIARRPR